jgi:hypothetical protein
MGYSHTVDTTKYVHDQSSIETNTKPICCSSWLCRRMTLENWMRMMDMRATISTRDHVIQPKGGGLSKTAMHPGNRP